MILMKYELSTENVIDKFLNFQNIFFNIMLKNVLFYYVAINNLTPHIFICVVKSTSSLIFSNFIFIYELHASKSINNDLKYYQVNFVVLLNGLQ